MLWLGTQAYQDSPKKKHSHIFGLIDEKTYLNLYTTINSAARVEKPVSE